MDVVDSDVRRWLDEGPTAGPPAVLAAALARTRATRQRPELLARALGAPGLAASGQRRAPSVRLAWLVVLLLVVFLASIVVMGGVFRPVPVPVVPIVPMPSADAGTPSPSPTVLASAQASLEPEPSVEPDPTPEATAVLGSGPAAPVSFPDLGFGAVPPPNTQASRVDDTVTFRQPRSNFFYALDPRFGVVTVNVGPTTAGVSFEFGGTATIKGRTLSDLLAVLEGFPGVTFPTNEALTLDGERARLVTVDRAFEPSSSVVIAVRADRIYVIQAAFGAPSEFSDNALRNESLLRTFVGGFRFIEDGTVLGAGFRIAYPEGWRATRRPNANGQLGIGKGEFGGGPSDIVSVDWATPGDLIMIGLGQEAGAATISGHDLASLAESTRTALPAATLTPISIGGEPGYRVGVRQSSSIYPLASLAICWHDQMAYVFMEHLVLEGTPSGDFETILAGVTFE